MDKIYTWLIVAALFIGAFFLLQNWPAQNDYMDDGPDYPICTQHIYCGL